MIKSRFHFANQAVGLALIWGIAALSFSGQGTAGVIFQDDFETCNTSKPQNGFTWSAGTNTAVNTANPKGGSCALEFTYQAVADGADSFSEQGFLLGGNYPDIWMRYDLYVPANYCHRTQASSANNKGFVMMWEGDYATPSGVMMNPNFWPDGSCQSTTSMFLWAPGSTDSLNKLGRHFWQSDFLDQYSIRTSDFGKWMEVITHYKYASSANNDGVAQIWITSQGGNKKQILNITNGAWYVPGALGFNKGYLLGWANSGFAQQTKLYIDNIVFSTDPIGMDPPAAVRTPAVR